MLLALRHGGQRSLDRALKVIIGVRRLQFDRAWTVNGRRCRRTQLANVRGDGLTAGVTSLVHVRFPVGHAAEIGQDAGVAQIVARSGLLEIVLYHLSGHLRGEFVAALLGVLLGTYAVLGLGFLKLGFLGAVLAHQVYNDNNRDQNDESDYDPVLVLVKKSRFDRGSDRSDGGYPTTQKLRRRNDAGRRGNCWCLAHGCETNRFLRGRLDAAPVICHFSDMSTLEREDRLKNEEFRKVKRSLPRLRKRLMELHDLDEINALRRQITDIESDRSQTEYLCGLAALIKTQTDEVERDRTQAAKQWEEEMIAQSLAIHQRQERAGNALWDHQIVIRFLGDGTPLAAEVYCTYTVHVNTTLPQLSVMVHQLARSEATDDYFPSTYNFWVVKPGIVDPFRRRSPREWIDRLNEKGARDAYDEMLPVQTSLGEALFYDSGSDSLDR